MKQAEKQLIREDKTFIRITYLTHCGRGEMIMKTYFYILMQKKIERKLKGLYYFIDYNYERKEEGSNG